MKLKDLFSRIRNKEEVKDPKELSLSEQMLMQSPTDICAYCRLPIRPKDKIRYIKGWVFHIKCRKAYKKHRYG